MEKNVTIKVRDAINTENILELDFNSFFSLNVGTTELDKSNDFLNSLWREFNLKLAPGGLDRCPWAYLPQKSINKTTSISYFGSMRTKLGIIHIAISYKIKGSIDNIHFFSESLDIMESKNKGIFKSIVREAKYNINMKFEYTVRCKLIGKYESTQFKLILNNYISPFFYIFVDNDISYIEFTIYAYELLDAYKNANIKLKLLVNFLAVETNIYFEYCDIDIFLKADNGGKENINASNIYQEDIYLSDLNCEDNKFIDFYPSYKGKVILSKNAVEFINKIISNKEENNELNIFLNSCYHFRQGLNKEYSLETKPYEITVETVVKLSSINQTETEGIIDGALTYYLSAIETATLINYKPQKCQLCGQLKFQINKRVYEFINVYLCSTHGDIFKKIYNLRSKYLHTGESYTSYFNTHVRPEIDCRTGTGCVDWGFITLNIKGEIIGVDITNIREWTSYSLRNFYKQIF